MGCPWAGILLLALQVVASQEGLWLQQSPAEIWTTLGQTVEINCTVSHQQLHVPWYREHQDGSLQWIARTGKYVPAQGRYSSKVSSTEKSFSLVISDVREEDSGVYYCALAAYILAGFASGTRLIVSDAAQPSLAILAPSPLEDAELPDPVPLLCLLSPQTRAWRAAVWDLEEGSPGQVDSAALEGEGTWSLTMVPREQWDTKTHCTCIAREEGTRRNIITVVAKDPDTTLKGPCWITHWVGLPCVCLLLLVQVLILLSTKCPHTAGRAAAPGSNVHPRQSPEIAVTLATLPILQQETSHLLAPEVGISCSGSLEQGQSSSLQSHCGPGLAQIIPRQQEAANATEQR
ncbi:putative immune-type receptor 1n precursor [Alligator mississippiensis]|uniref:Immune-type receptor 1n n=1 Tax=Alligator mississippiensis TaxID=8496 RepID=A0A151MAT4_ALLMI|nr:putative immune-type receptor 1n precursor [Alligator mississippiensis]